MFVIAYLGLPYCGAQVTPPGFQAIVLPFADDLRSLPRVPAATAASAAAAEGEEGEKPVAKGVPVGAEPVLAAAAQELVGETVTLDRSALLNIYNPVLQKQYHMLQVKEHKLDLDS